MEGLMIKDIRAFLAGAAALAAVPVATEPWGIRGFTEPGAAHAAVLPGRVGQGPLLAAVSDDDEDTIVSLFENATASVVSIMNVEVNGSGKEREELERRSWKELAPDLSGMNTVHIVTNYHVVAKLATDTSGRQACRVSLLAPTGAMQTYAATLVGTDPSRDLAVLKVISGLGREIPAPTGAAIRGAIQTDAAINAGNSGGPLLDSFGRIIGVNTATFTRSGSGSSSGVNFAIPVDMVRRVVPRLIVYGAPRPPAV
ncbi:unnamed protein product [Closterium sp. NIES-64]|nr:unnamed protein product [Closterium sp. NIES-64]